MDVVELKGVTAGAVDQRRQRNRGLLAHAGERGHGGGALGSGKRGDLACPRQRGAEQTAADAVQHRELHTLDRFVWNVCKAQIRCKRRQIARRARQQ